MTGWVKGLEAAPPSLKARGKPRRPKGRRSKKRGPKKADKRWF